MAQTEDRLLEEKAHAIIKGDAEPPNEVVAHAARRVREIESAAAALAKRLNEMRGQAIKMQDAGLKLHGARDSYREDIINELRRLHRAPVELAEEIKNG